ncbi:hypothetical protein HPB50_028795 [Hyalomma asiaticum]|nr:hypothetical protein HPB50_028795 [Hyalomma asiaticum]
MLHEFQVSAAVCSRRCYRFSRCHFDVNDSRNRPLQSKSVSTAQSARLPQLALATLSKSEDIAGQFRPSRSTSSALRRGPCQPVQLTIIQWSPEKSAIDWGHYDVMAADEDQLPRRGHYDVMAADEDQLARR